MNIYKQILHQNLPRLYSMYDLDGESPTYGYGDRLFWGWKVSDFVNGTFQGGVHAIAIAIRMEIAGEEAFALSVIDAAILALPRICRNNGSLEEAYPGENSFCVTALVTFDVLSALEHLGDRIDDSSRQQYLEAVEPLIHFLVRNNEEHAFISNHLATAFAALNLWNRITGTQHSKAQVLRDAILQKQSVEGWYLEYEGADPGYQTLALHYLYATDEWQTNTELVASFKKSIAYLDYFCLPDGTIGGLYGSRNTEVYYPGGIIGLAGLSKTAAKVAAALHRGVKRGSHIFPQGIDPGNFIPLINSYAVAALEVETRPEAVGYDIVSETEPLVWQKHFSEAGVHIESTECYYAIVNYKKGGTLKVYDRQKQCVDFDDGGLFGRLKDGRRFSTQCLDVSNGFENCTVESSFFLINESKPSPLSFILLRLLSITVFRSIFLGNIFKKVIVRMLMTGKKKLDGKAVRRFSFLENRIVVDETVTPPKGTEKIGHAGKSRAIHMASSGYYLPQDQTRPSTPRLVEIQETVS